VDQPTPGNHRTVSRLTPVGTVQLEKFRPARKLLLPPVSHTDNRDSVNLGERSDESFSPAGEAEYGSPYWSSFASSRTARAAAAS
jgi:hypothetical protein